jgi:hypothetical protein
MSKITSFLVSKKEISNPKFLAKFRQMWLLKESESNKNLSILVLLFFATLLEHNIEFGKNK